MARGFTDIYFTGGTRDGLMMPQVAINQLSYMMAFSGDTFFAEADSGEIAVMKGPLNDKWVSYGEEIYTKVEKSSRQKNEKGVVYEFLKTNTVERCSSITKKNMRCLHGAIEGELYCATHRPRR